MEANDARGGGRSTVVRRPVHYLRKRSLHRVWWTSARVSLKRGHSGEPPHPPNGDGATGKRV
jgi:hypothetical protein